MLRLFLVISGCLLFIFPCNAQSANNADNQGRNTVVFWGYYRTAYSVAEFGFGKSYSTIENVYSDMRMGFVGTELLFNSNKIYVCPKIGAEFSFLLFCVRSNLLYQTDFKTGALVLRPEIGLTAFGYFHILYSYNITLVNQTPLRETHGLHLQFNLFAGGRNYENTGG
jgi:hypothetical protein